MKSKKLSKELNSILSEDQWILELHLDGYSYADKVDELFEGIKKKYSLSVKDIQKIIYTLIYNNKIAFFVNLGTFSLSDGNFDRFFRIKCNFHHKLINKVNFQKLRLKELTIKKVIERIDELLETKKLMLIDGDWNPLVDDEYEKVQLMFKVSVNKKYKSLLDLAEYYKDQKHIFNNLIIEYLEKTKDSKKINRLLCDGKIKKMVKKDILSIKKIFYEDYYKFFEDQSMPSFADNNPFYELYKSLFEAMKDSIKSRKEDIILYARKLKIASEQFDKAIRASQWKVKDKCNLSKKFDTVVNFSRWLYNLRTYFDKEYYFTYELEKELLNYLDFIEQKLYYPTILLLTSNLHTEKYTIFEEDLRYYSLQDFYFKKLTDKIDKDYKKDKNIKEICKRRNNSTLWKNEGNQSSSRGKQFEDALFPKIKSLFKKVERNKRLVIHTGTDFLASDGKNTLVLIEAKTGSNSAKPNEIKKLFPVIKALEIKNSFYIINEEVINQDSIKNAKDFCKISNINFKQVNSTNIQISDIVTRLK